MRIASIVVNAGRFCALATVFVVFVGCESRPPSPPSMTDGRTLSWRQEVERRMTLAVASPLLIDADGTEAMAARLRRIAAARNPLVRIPANSITDSGGTRSPIPAKSITPR